ncbi:prepilin peptidase, partial [Rhizobium brockwellii]|uniref:A24 family peptidase n=1 Tax=Rhizobium brockwellii TaxID=3019932 RepID=UPI003F95829F
ASVFVILPLCLAMAAFSDLFTMTIPTRISVILIASFLVLAPFSGLGLEMIGMHLDGAAIVFSACFALFAFNVMGGGDAKMLSATALWFG